MPNTQKWILKYLAPPGIGLFMVFVAPGLYHDQGSKGVAVLVGLTIIAIWAWKVLFEPWGNKDC